MSECLSSGRAPSEHALDERSSSDRERKSGLLSAADRCRALRDRWYPKEVRPYQVYTAAVLRSLPADGVLVDSGCGREARWLRNVADSAGRAIGMDFEIARQLEDPKLFLARADAHHPPLADACADVVSTMNTVEHFENPVVVFREFLRLLKPGGRLFVLTVNQSFLPIVAARLLPHRLRQRINAAATDSKPEDTFPVFYRANSVKALARIARETGFDAVRLDYLSNHPEYFMFSPLAYRCWALVERAILRRKLFQGGRHFILAEFRKPA
ncbi:MAG: methyltransferase domain-containing protein [Phycisphaerales bacterium]|nr:methyltransferase domain-containing protein [Phycisphaerales bacterium]